ncbi:hypothetical protein VdG1_08074 [Verticillium dahliae VDG1]|nr:hypothetical protein VdG1_08074 [Verticillium dahliae VDG1]
MRSSLRDAGGLLAGAFTAKKGPRYHKIDWEGSDESDYISRQVPLSRSLGRCLPCGLGRWSLKTVLATVGSLVILTLLAVVGRLRLDDLVLIVDAYDVWFQLPPRVLIERFLAQNAAADARILAGWSPDAPDAIAAPTQRVIVSTQKKCWPRPRDGHETHCDVLPESTARADLYGPETDKGNPDRDGHALHRTRPRYINSGAVLGRADDVLRTFRRAYAKVREGQDAGKNLFSDQGILGEILGQQEVWRTMQRERQALALAGEPFNETAYPPDVAAVGGGAETWEYGLGLDYLQELFVPTVFEEDDGEYMAVNDAARINVSSEERGLSPARITGLPSDVDSLAPPLVHAGVELEEQHRDEAAHWDAVPLYTDYYTGRMPVGVHHNAHRDGMKGWRLKMWWDKNWFHPFLRDIVAAREVRPIKLAPLAVIKATSSWTRDVVYWPPASDAERRRPRIFDRKTLSQGLDEAEWHTLCRKQGERPWWDIVFDDDGGPEDLGPKKAANSVKPEVEVKEPGGGTKADEKPQDEGQGERKPTGEAIIKR